MSTTAPAKPADILYNRPATAHPAYAAALARGIRAHGDKYDPAQLEGVAEAVRKYYGSDTRVILRTTYSDGSTHTRAGRIGLTTGWRPAFLLMSSTRAIGSSDVIGPEHGTGNRTEVVGVKRPGERYYTHRSRIVTAPRGQVYTDPTDTPSTTAQNGAQA